MSVKLLNHSRKLQYCTMYHFHQKFISSFPLLLHIKKREDHCEKYWAESLQFIPCKNNRGKMKKEIRRQKERVYDEIQNFSRNLFEGKFAPNYYRKLFDANTD